MKFQQRKKARCRNVFYTERERKWPFGIYVDSREGGIVSQKYRGYGRDPEALPIISEEAEISSKNSVIRHGYYCFCPRSGFSEFKENT